MMRKGIIYVYFNRAKYEKEGIEKYYIGQTVKTMERRAGKDGRGYGYTDPNCNTKFANSIRKWGWDAFERRVLEEVYEEDLDKLEKFYIEHFDSYKNGYNETIGGEGVRGYNLKEESKKKIGIAVKKRLEDPKEREKISEAQKNRWKDPKEREKQSITIKTFWEKPEIREKMSKSQIKRYKNLKEREKASKIQKKHWEDPKVREKQSIAQKNRWKDQKAREKQSITIKTSWEKPEIREKQSITIKTSWEDAEIREKRSKAIKTSWEDAEIREKRSKAIKKHYEDPEARKKQSESMKKYWENEEERKKISCEKNHNAKSVYCNELNTIFSYIGLAKKYCVNVLNSKINSISAVCDGKAKSTGGYNGTKLTWSWTKNLDKEILNKAEFIDSEKYEKIINERKKYGIPRELNYYATSVYCNELNIIFSYTKLAKKYCINILNSKIGLISDVCDGKAKSTGEYNGTKLTWSWTKNLDKEILNKAEFIDSEKYEKIINERKKYGIPRELNYYATSVYCNELNILFSHIRLATEYCKNVLNIKIGRIDRTCNSKAKYSGKLSDGTKLTWSWTKNLNKEILNNAIYIDNKKYEEIINAKNK